MSDTKFKEAFDVFTEELRKDEGLYIAYQANIAMSFFDACQGAGYRFPELHKISNIAADNFLKLLLSKARQDLEENSNSQPTNAGTPLLEPEPHLGPREPMRGDAFVEFVDE